MRWLEDPGFETPILWIHGLPGVGKSSIARKIAEMCTQSEKSLASFFFSREGRNTAEKLVPSLAYQFSLSIPEIREDLIRVLGEDPLLPSRNLNIQAQSLIIKPLIEYDLRTAPGLENRARRRVIILDGLDECRPEDQRNILEMLSKIGADHSQSSPFFLVFSRPENHIKTIFTKEPLRSLTWCLALNDYVVPQFSELNALYVQLLSSSSTHVEEILQILSLLLLCKSLPSQASVIDEFLSFIPGSTATILGGLPSILLVPSPANKELDNKIEITDASFSEFLLDRRRSGKYFINTTERRSTITRRLLQILLTEDYSKVLKDACQAALPDVLESLYDIDLARFVVPMSPADLNSTRLQDWEFVAKFFLWMEHQIHPKRKSNLFHYHLPAINKWMHGLLDRLRPHSLVTEVKSINFLSLPNANAGNVALGQSQDPEVDVLLIIAELKPDQVHCRPACTELSFHMYTLRSTSFDVLLRKFIAAPSPGEKYLLNGEKCARLARALWMYVLPYKVRKSLMDKRFGQPYPAPLTFHRFNGMEISSEEELSLVLLPKILPKVPEAEADSLVELLEVVRDHPLLKYFDSTHELYRLYKEVSDASEQYLTPDLFNRLERPSEP